jgi:hypothetical protein
VLARFGQIAGLQRQIAKPCKNVRLIRLQLQGACVSFNRISVSSCNTHEVAEHCVSAGILRLQRQTLAGCFNGFFAAPQLAENDGEVQPCLMIFRLRRDAAANPIDRFRARVTLERDEAHVVEARRMTWRLRENAPMRNLRLIETASLQALHRLAKVRCDARILTWRRIGT